MTVMTYEKPPVWYWGASALSVLWAFWGLLSLAALWASDIISEEPFLLIGFFIVCAHVLANLVGSAGLVLRKKWSANLYWISFASVIVLAVWLEGNLFVTFKNADMNWSWEPVTMLPLLLLAGIAGIFIRLSRYAATKSRLHS